MDTLKERQLTVRASRRPIEYNYTNADIHHGDEGSGYQFEYPLAWTGDQSTQKVIGIRRISYKPSSLNLAFRFSVNDEDEKFKGNPIEIPLTYVFTDQNTFEECINCIVSDANDALVKVNSDARCVSKYDKELGTIEITFENATTFYKFKTEFVYGMDLNYDPDDDDFDEEPKYWYYKGEFLKLFNQEVTKENVDKLYESHSEPVTKLAFTNVWNRDHFYCHASFSDSPRRIIGINGDFWPTPSVLYDYSDNSNDFNVYFTTDTVHRILPRNGVMLIQLSYIFNYQTSMLQYA